MSFVVRTLEQISKAIRGDLRRELPGTDATVWPNTLSVFGKVVAMANHLIELRLNWVYDQIFASTADVRHLERHAYEYGLARRAASRASGYVLATGAPDTVYPAGIAFLSGVARYLVSSDARSDETGAVTLLVHSDAIGASANREAGAQLTLIDPALQPTLDGIALVGDDGIGGGAEAEDDDSLRARVLDRKRRPPQGGAESDYEQFALAVPGVVKAWAHRFAHGPGTIGVWFLFAGRENLIPTDGDVLAVQDYIDQKRLIRAAIVVSAPEPYPVDITIYGLADDSEKVRAAIRVSLEKMFFERARPGVAASPAAFSRSWISEAISQAIGEDRHQLISPVGDFLFNDGRIPVVGEIDYV